MSGVIAIINAVAWPLAILAVAVLFRHEFRGALARLGQFKYAGMEMTFRENLRDAEALARVAPKPDSLAAPGFPARVQLEVAPGEASELHGTLVGHEATTTPSSSATILVATPPKPGSRPARTLESLLQLCGESPREGVLEAWGELNRVILHAAAVLGDRRTPAPVRVDAAARFLVDRGWLSGVEGQLIERLRTLGEHVDRREGPPVNGDDARRYVDLAGPLIDRIKALG